MGDATQGLLASPMGGGPNPEEMEEEEDEMLFFFRRPPFLHAGMPLCGFNVVICLLYCVCGTSLSLINGWLFLRSPMRFPITMTTFHMITVFALAHLVRLIDGMLGLQWVTLSDLPPEAPPYTKPMLGALAAANIGLNNCSLLFLNAAMNQLVKATMPLSAALFSGYFLQRRYSGRSWLGFCGIATGVSLACFNNPHANVIGVALCVGSLGTGTGQLILAEKFTQSHKVDALSYAMHTALWSAVALAPFAMMFDLGVFVNQVALAPGPTAVAVGVTSALAFANNFLLYATVASSSSAFAGVVGNLKVVCVIVLQHVLWPSDAQEMELAHYVGAVMTIVCFCYLSLLQFLPETKADVSREMEDALPTSLKTFTVHENDELVAAHRLIDAAVDAATPKLAAT